MSYYSNFMAMQCGDTAGSPWDLKTVKKDRIISLSLSFGVHAVFFIVGGMMLMKPVQYAIDLGKNGVEVNLVAAPQEVVQPVIQKKVEEVVPVPIKKAIVPEVIQPKISVQPKVVEPIKVAKTVETPKPVGAPAVNSGKDKVTFHSDKGALTEAKPNYLKNPAPAYPWEARQKGWEGTTVLNVVVSPAGKPLSVSVINSSGHKVLDETALKTVKKWQFQPAQLGNVPVESTVHVPIRFKLENQSKNDF